MTIPRIAPYPLPTRDELPTPRADFRPDPARALLLVHDMQEHFVDFFAREQSPLAPLLHNIRRLRDACDARGVPVAYSAQPSDAAPESRGLLNAMWGPGILARPEFGSIVAELSPLPHHQLVAKHRYSALHGTDLLRTMRELGLNQLWICGIYAHIGCLLTASDAFMADVEPLLVADALGDFSRTQHDQALSIVADCCGMVSDTARVCEALAPAKPTTAWLDEELSRLGVDAAQLTAGATLQDHGLDSVRLLELSERLTELGVPVSFMDMAEHPTLGSLRDYLVELQSEAREFRHG